MEIKKEHINALIGPTDSGKKEFLYQSLGIKDMQDLYDVSYRKMIISDVLSEKTKSQRKKENALKLVGLPNTFLNRKMNEISSGEYKKISIAYTLCDSSDTYIFLHPTIGLDGKNKQNLIKLFRLLKTRYKKTIIIVSSDTDWVHQFADFLLVVYNSTAVAKGNVYDIFCDTPLCKKYKIEIPKIIQFEQRVLEKKHKRIEYRNDIKDVIKDIYRNI